MQQNESSAKSLLFNILIPILSLFQLHKLLEAAGMPPSAATKTGLVIALAFPAGYFIYHLAKYRKSSMLAVVGFLGILITGLIGLLELPRQYVAIERAAVPLIIGAAIVLSNHTSAPLVDKLFYNPMVFNTTKIDTLAAANGKATDLKKALRNTSYMLAGSFIISAVCNYLITSHYMQDLSLPYTEALGKVKMISLAVVTIPCLVVMIAALLYFTNRLKKITGVADSDELYSQQLQDKATESNKKG